MLRFSTILFSTLSWVVSSYVAADRLSQLPYDWVPYEEISLDIRNSIAPYCSGRLIEPDWPGLHTQEDDPLSNIKIKAKQLTEDSNSIYTAVGDVLLSQGNIQLEADKVTFNPIDTQGTFEGSVRLRFPGTAIESSEGVFQLNSRSADLLNSIFVLHNQNYTGTASSTEIRGTDYRLKTATITPCNPVNPAWSLATNSLEVDHEKGLASAGHTRLNILGVPVLYTPYIRFPIDDRRVTGLLTPTIELGLGNSNFESLAFPFYWNIAPHMDSTITPIHRQFRGWLFHDETRYLGNTYFGQLDLGTTSTNDRWLIGYSHQQVLENNINMSISWNDYSDNLVAADFQNSEKTTDFSKKQLSLQRIQNGKTYLFNFERWDLIPGHENLSALPYSSQPEISVSSYKTMSPGIRLNWDVEAANFYRHLTDQQLATLNQTNGETAHGWRESIFTSATYKAEIGKLRITPQAEVGFASYQVDTPGIGRPETTEWLVPRTSLDMSYAAQFGRSSNLSNLLTPRAKWVYTPYINQYSSPTFDSHALGFSKSQLFRNNRFDGRDRFGDMNRVNLGFTHSISNQKKPQSITTNIGQIIRIQPEKMGLTQDVDTSLQDQVSPIYGNLDIVFNADLKLSVTQNWNPIADRFDLQSYAIAYRPESNALLNLSLAHEWNKTNWQDDLHFSAILPIFRRWGLATAMDYNYTRDELEDTLVGIEYDGCCWNLRLLGKFAWTEINTEIPKQNSFYMQFYLKGLGDNSTIIDELLSQRILGYKGRLYQ